MNDIPKLFTTPTTDYTVVYAFLAVVGLILFVIIYAIIAKIKGWELPQRTTKATGDDELFICKLSQDANRGYPDDLFNK